MMGKAAEAAAKKKGHRSSRNHRPPRPDLAPSRPSPRPPPPSHESRRSLRPRRRRLPIADIDVESEEEERGRRKLKLVLNLPLIPAVREDRRSDSPSIYRSRKPAVDSAAVAAHVPPAASTSASASSASFSSHVDEDAVKPPKKRRINGYDDGLVSDGSGHQERKKNGLSRSKASVSGMSPNLPKGTPLPERKTLESILDKLQKKDIYHVFSQPVDPEELPDYYDLIEHPMDFGTIRKKLASNAYRSFEQFEDDVFLICSNAMHYNAPDTIYFRQARAIQDMARKKFQILRADAKCIETERRSEEKIKFSTVEKKSLQKSICRAEQKPLGSDISSGATLASAGDTCTGLSTVQANDVEKPATANGLVDGNSSLGESKSEKAGLVDGNSSLGESKSEKAGIVDGNSSLGDCRSEKADELSAKCSPSKLMQKPFFVDVNRRATYNKSEQQPIIESDSMFDVFESEAKQLVDVRLDAENSYARSLAHFAASLGPIGWEIASKEIEKALPAGIKFGPGWVGEYEPLPTPVLSLENHTQQQLRYNSNLQSRVTSTKDKKGEERSKATQNGDSEVMQLGPKSQVNTGMSHRASSPGEGTLFGGTKTGKKGLFGVSAETQPRISNTMLQKQKDQVAIDFSKSYVNVPEQVRVCNSASVSSIPVGTALRRTECHFESRKLRLSGVCTETQPGTISSMSPQQKDQVAVDFTKASNNVPEQARVFISSSASNIPVEKAQRRPECHSEARKQGWFGNSSEIQPRITNTMLQQHKDRVAIDLAKASNNVPEQVGVFNLSSSRVPSETALRRPKCHSEAEKPVWFGFSAETEPRISNLIPQQQKDRVPTDFPKAYSNVSDQFGACNSSSVGSIPVEAALRRTDSHSEVATSRPLETISRNRNQVQPEPRKQPAAVISQSGNDALGLAVGGSSNGKFTGTYNNRGNTLEYLTNNQSGVAGCFVTHGNREQTIDFRLMGLGLPGNISNQPNNSNAGIYTVKQAMPPILPRRDDPSAVAASRAWMSYGPSAECRSVDGMGFANTQIGSGSFHNSSWRAPTSATMVHGGSNTSPVSPVLPHPTPLATAVSQAQNGGLAFYPQLVAADLSRFRGRSPWQGLVPHAEPGQKKDVLPPDLNFGFQAPGSPSRPSSGILVDPQQPDLALQL